MRKVTYSPEKTSGQITSLEVEIHDTCEPIKRVFLGRTAWALDQLMSAGKRGCTPITHPGPRWSKYVADLREAEVRIETVREPHGGAYAGTHGRYVLLSKVKRIKSGSGTSARSLSRNRDKRASDECEVRA